MGPVALSVIWGVYGAINFVRSSRQGKDTVLIAKPV